GTWIELRLTASLENQQVPCFLPPASESLAREGRGEEDAIRNIGSATAIVCKGSSDIFFVVCLQSSPFAQDCELLHLNGQRRRPRRTQLVRHCCRKTKEMQFSTVAPLEFVPLGRVVVEPPAQLGAGSYVFHPEVHCGTLLA